MMSGYRMLRNIGRKLFSKTTNEEMVDKKDLVYHFTAREIVDQYRIMVIDDEEVACDMFRMSLEQAGYIVETFLNGETALARLKEQKFDIVVMDLMTKGIDGTEVPRTVNLLYPETKTIMITAFTKRDTAIKAAIEALRGDVHDFIPKPVKLKELKASIQRALQNEPSCQP
jgi:DNA-binding NtrC family response regulator